MGYKTSPLYGALQKSGKSQLTVAKEIGVDRGVFGRIVRQQQLPTRDQAIWIAKALGVPVEQLFPEQGFRGGEIEQQKEAQIAERILLLDRRAAELLATNAALEAQRKEMLETFAVKVSEMQSEITRLTHEVANRDKEIADLKGVVAKASLERWSARLTRDQEKQALQQQITALEAQVDAANARVATGVAIAGLGALAILAARE